MSKLNGNFLDVLFDVLMELSAPGPETNEIELITNFISSLPGVNTYEKIDQKEKVIKGRIYLCSRDAYNAIPSENRSSLKSIYYVFQVINGRKVAQIHMSDNGTGGTWHETLEELVDRVSPAGDKLSSSWTRGVMGQFFYN